MNVYEYICQLPEPKQRQIEKMIENIGRNGQLSGTQLKEQTQEAMNSKIVDLARVIDFQKMEVLDSAE